MLGYRFGPLRLATAMRLPELGSAETPCRGAWRIRVSHASRRERVRWIHSWAFPDGRPWAKIGRVDGGYIVRFERTASFRIDETKRCVVARSDRRVPIATVRHLLLDQVLPLIIAEGAHLVLHASGVALGGRAVAFVGASGSGKSTVAASCLRRGYTLVADDSFVVDVGASCAIPTCSGLRLWPDAIEAFFAGDISGTPVAHYTRKRRLTEPRPRYRRTPLPMRAVCVLERGRAGAAPSLTRLRGQAAFAAMLRCTFQLDTDRGGAARALNRVALLLERTPAYRLLVPQGLARLDELPDLIGTLAAF